jgi:hypothetical protein
MSSIEEEDESVALDDIATEVERLPPPSPSSSSSQQELYRSSSALEWDSELSESEGEEGDRHSNDDDEEQAANRVLQSFIQSSTRAVSSSGRFYTVPWWQSKDNQSIRDRLFEGIAPKQLFSQY